MVYSLTDYKDVIIIFIVGVFVGWILTRVIKMPAQTPAVYVPQQIIPQQITNEEKWDMWEDQQGHIHTVIHRKVNR